MFPRRCGLPEFLHTEAAFNRAGTLAAVASATAANARAANYGVACVNNLFLIGICAMRQQQQQHGQRRIKLFKLKRKAVQVVLQVIHNEFGLMNGYGAGLHKQQLDERHLSERRTHQCRPPGARWRPDKVCSLLAACAQRRATKVLKPAI